LLTNARGKVRQRWGKYLRDPDGEAKERKKQLAKQRNKR
jgi:hypothetical protein